jgi:hypothetical protein
VFPLSTLIRLFTLTSLWLRNTTTNAEYFVKRFIDQSVSVLVKFLILEWMMDDLFHSEDNVGALHIRDKPIIDSYGAPHTQRGCWRTPIPTRGRSPPTLKTRRSLGSTMTLLWTHVAKANLNEMRTGRQHRRPRYCMQTSITSRM